MSADKYYLVSSDNKATEKNSIFALEMRNDKGGGSSGEIYYFNKNEEKSKKIIKLRDFNDKEKKFHIIVYNGRELAYYKPGKGKFDDDEELVEKLNLYDKCVIVNITVKEYKNTYIFLSEELTKHDTGEIFDQMKIENVETFKKGNLIDIVRALFNLIEDYHINIGGVEQIEVKEAVDETVRGVEQGAAPAARATSKMDRWVNRADSAARVRAEEERKQKEKEEKEEEERLAKVAADNARLQQVEEGDENQEAALAAAAQVNRHSATGGRGKRKYKANVNQKSLKKMSTIIKKLLKINLNIKPVAKPTAKPKAKPAAKPTAKPKAKPTAKPKAKPVAKPKAKPVAKPKAKPAAKPTAKPKAKPTAKPKAKPTAKPKAKPTAKPKAKPTAKPKAKPVAKPKAKPAAKPKAKK